jgi:hypothetical protein
MFRTALPGVDDAFLLGDLFGLVMHVKKFSTRDQAASWIAEFKDRFESQEYREAETLRIATGASRRPRLPGSRLRSDREEEMLKGRGRTAETAGALLRLSAAIPTASETTTGLGKVDEGSHPPAPL